MSLSPYSVSAFVQSNEDSHVPVDGDTGSCSGQADNRRTAAPRPRPAESAPTQPQPPLARRRTMSTVTESIAGVTIPDSRLVREATELVRDAASPLLFNHS